MPCIEVAEDARAIPLSFGQEHAAASRVDLHDLAEGPYFVLAGYMDEWDLCQTDATCRLLLQLNCVFGPWRALGARAFAGLELDGAGPFDFDESDAAVARCMRIRGLPRIDWKARYRHFTTEIVKLRSDILGAAIHYQVGQPYPVQVTAPDEVAYLRCKLRMDVFNRSSTRGVYIEVEVDQNADNLSFALVDFDEGGRSSVTFSPDTGAVIRERKIQESPRRVKGSYIQPLQPKNQRFEGYMGVYIKDGKVAFFRRYRSSEPVQQASVQELQVEDGVEEANTYEDSVSDYEGIDDDDDDDDDGDEDEEIEEGNEACGWETTGFVIDLGWAQGRGLSPCLAFRDEGSYRVRIVRVDSTPPVRSDRLTAAYEEKNWMELNWEVSDDDAEEETDEMPLSIPPLQ